MYAIALLKMPYNLWNQARCTNIDSDFLWRICCPTLWLCHVLKCNNLRPTVARTFRSQSVEVTNSLLLHFLPQTVRRFNNQTGLRIFLPHARRKGIAHSLATTETRSTKCFTEITDFVQWNTDYVNFNNPNLLTSHREDMLMIPVASLALPWGEMINSCKPESICQVTLLND